MTKPLIAIDIDDTIADSTESLRIAANERSGLNIPAEVYRQKGEYWGYYEAILAKYGIDKVYTLQDNKAEMEADQSTILVIEGARDALATLTKHYRIVFITAREESCEPATHRWLAEKFDGLKYDLHFIDHIHGESGLTKGQLCKRLGAELLIDDNDAHCQSAVAEGVGAIRFGEYGWHGENEDQIPCCKTWQDVLEYLGVN